ncbi:MAG: hypothetical protein A2X02_00210 [Bacteroidetes bacterium GWF2_29_10]|nr:MAG: hypothetical protein A2X02_00210 [Bacteroidetes bacterium GWF2_29_10]
MKNYIPNITTLLNLFSGCVAVVLLSGGNFYLSVWFIIASSVFDFFDGMFARLLNSTSKIGKDLDSLADMVSFGLYPGFVMYWLLSKSTLPECCGLYIPFLGFLITCFSALRLAIFNNDESQAINFMGLPTPANTLFILSLPYILINNYGHLIVSYYTILMIVIFSSLILVAPIELFSLKIKNITWHSNKFIFTLIIISILLFSFFTFKSIPIIILLYIILSIIKKIVK